MVKKILIIFSMLTLLCGMSAFAKPTNQLMSEYDFFTSLQQKPISELQNSGMSKEAINTLKNASFQDLIKERRANYNDEELRSIGYSKKQIDIFNNFNGSEKQMRALGATMSMSCNEFQKWQDGEDTFFVVKVNWEWNSLPIFAKNDAVVLSWSNDWHVDDSTDYSTELTYQAIGDTNWTEIKYRPHEKPEIQGVVFRHSVTYQHPNHSGVTFWSKKGNFMWKVRSNSKTEASFLAKYAHAVTVYSPSIDITGTPSITIGNGSTCPASDNEYMNINE